VRAHKRGMLGDSELHGVDPVVPGERETGTEVLPEEGGLVGLDVLGESLVDGFLGGGTLGSNGLLLSFVEYVSALGLGGLVFEKSIIDLGDVDACGRHFRAGGDRVDLVHALEGHAVDLEGAGDKEQTGGQLLEEHDSAASVSSRGKDEHGASLDALAELGGVLLLCAHLTLLVLSRVPIECLDH